MMQNVTTRRGGGDVSDLLQSLGSPSTPKGVDVNCLGGQPREAAEAPPRRPAAPLPIDAVSWEQERARVTGFGAGGLTSKGRLAGMPQQFHPPTPAKGNGRALLAASGPRRMMRRTFHDLRTAAKDDQLARDAANMLIGSKEAFQRSAHKAHVFLKQINHQAYADDGTLSDSSSDAGTTRPGGLSFNATGSQVLPASVPVSGGGAAAGAGTGHPSSPPPRRPPGRDKKRALRGLGPLRVGDDDLDGGGAAAKPRGKVSPLPEGTNVRGIFRSAIDESPVGGSGGACAGGGGGGAVGGKKKTRLQLNGAHALQQGLPRVNEAAGGDWRTLKGAASFSGTTLDDASFRLADGRAPVMHSPRGMSVDMGLSQQPARRARQPTHFTFEGFALEQQQQRRRRQQQRPSPQPAEVLSMQQSMVAYRQQMIQNTLLQQQIMQQRVAMEQNAFQQQQQQQLAAAQLAATATAHSLAAAQRGGGGGGGSSDRRVLRAGGAETARLSYEALDTKRSMTGHQVPSGTKLIVELSNLRLRAPFKCSVVMRIAGDKSRAKGRPILIVDPVPRRVESLDVSDAPVLKRSSFIFNLATLPDTNSYEKVVLRLFQMDERRREPVGVAVCHLASMADQLRANLAGQRAGLVASRLSFLHSESQHFQGSIEAAFSLQHTGAVQ